MNASVRIYRQPDNLVLQSVFRRCGLINLIGFLVALGLNLPVISSPTHPTTLDRVGISLSLMTLLFMFGISLFCLVFQLKYQKHLLSPEVQVLSDGLQVRIWYQTKIWNPSYAFENCIPWDTIQQVELKVLSWVPGKPVYLKFTTGKNQWVKSPWPLENLAEFQDEIAQYVPANHPLLQFVIQWQAEHPVQKKLIESKAEKS